RRLTVRLSIAARRGLLPLVAVALATGAAAWWSVLRAPVPAPAVVLTRPADATALTDDAIRLYAAGQLARACDRFSEAAGERPNSAARREDVGRCFETWGWRTLAQGRPEEAALLFGQGLAAVPDDPALLKAAGVAAVHAGRVARERGAVRAGTVQRRHRLPRLGQRALRRPDPAAAGPGPACARGAGAAPDPRVRARRDPPPRARAGAALAAGGPGPGAGGP